MRILRKISGIFTQLSWNSENQISKNANFLDLNINKQNFIFQTKLYGKRDNSDFNIIRMPINPAVLHIRCFPLQCPEKYCKHAKQQLNFRTIKSAKMLIGKIMKQRVFDKPYEKYPIENYL